MKEISQSIQVNTGSGEIGVVEIPLSYRTSRKDWQIKYLTTDCSRCPFFIPPEELNKIIPNLETSKVMRVKIPKNIDGVCMVRQEQTHLGLTGSSLKYIIYQFLVKNRFHGIHGCKNPSKGKRLTRAEERRAEGKLSQRF